MKYVKLKEKDAWRENENRRNEKKKKYDELKEKKHGSGKRGNKK